MPYIGAIKNGNRSCRNAALQKIAAALHVEVRDLFISPNDYPPELDLTSTQNFLLQESVVHNDAHPAPEIPSSFGINPLNEDFLNVFDFSPTNESLWQQESIAGSSSTDDPDRHIGPAAKRARQR